MGAGGVILVPNSGKSLLCMGLISIFLFSEFAT
jgi:hypothetical protein